MASKADTVLRIVGIVAGLGVLADGVICWKFCPDPTIRDYVASIILEFCGILLVVSEFSHWFKNRFKILAQMVSFLKYRTGRGVFYLIAGALCLTKYTWMILIGAVVIVVGVINLIVAIWVHCVSKKRPQKSSKPTQGAPDSIPFSDEHPTVSLTENAV